MDEIVRHPSSSISNLSEHPKDCKEWTPTQARQNLKLWTGLNEVKLRLISIRIVPDRDLFQGGSEYGTPVAIWEMLHNSKSKKVVFKQQMKFENWSVLIVLRIGINSI
jgi:hypothetical protein